MKQSPQMLLMGLLSILPLACTTSTTRAPESGVIAPDSTLESYYLPFWDEKPEEKTRLACAQKRAFQVTPKVSVQVTTSSPSMTVPLIVQSL